MTEKKEKEIVEKEKEESLEQKVQIKKPTEKTSEEEKSDDSKANPKIDSKEEDVKVKENEESKEEKKTTEGKKSTIKKSQTLVDIKNVPISTKHSIAICNFIRKKEIAQIIPYLEDVLRLKKSIPMTGEIPHRKGRGVMSGRFPKKATMNFIKILKSASANAIYNGIENPFILEAVSNIGIRPYGRFGRVRRKRTHIRLIISSKKETGNKKMGKNKK
ncbi:hypothetical protein K0A97_01690 [Patescibacteria group bacterium]|nr:hypothetical protein [Patescibacteria group bacterium]